jgi:hypothetical protein
LSVEARRSAEAPTSSTAFAIPNSLSKTFTPRVIQAFLVPVPCRRPHRNLLWHDGNSGHNPLRNPCQNTQKTPCRLTPLPYTHGLPFLTPNFHGRFRSFNRCNYCSKKD